MMRYLGNAFSLNMVDAPVTLYVDDVAADEVPVDAQSVVGHETTAAVLSGVLDRIVPYNRKAIRLYPGDEIYVATLFDRMGKPFRSPEGRELTRADLEGLAIHIRRVVIA